MNQADAATTQAASALAQDVIVGGKRLSSAQLRGDPEGFDGVLAREIGRAAVKRIAKNGRVTLGIGRQLAKALTVMDNSHLSQKMGEGVIIGLAENEAALQAAFDRVGNPVLPSIDVTIELLEIVGEALEGVDGGAQIAADLQRGMEGFPRAGAPGTNKRRRPKTR